MASKRSMHSLLYGDVVFLYCKTGGYVFSEVTSTTCGSIIVYPVSPKNEDDPAFPNLKMGAFKVLAADKVKAQQRLADIRKTLLTQRKGATKLSTEEKELIQSAKRNAEVEMRNNSDEQERVIGTPVLYGNTIQLLHVFSGKYVSMNPVDISKTENINLQAELTTENSEHAFFKILPRYKVKSIGHEVYLHDQVTFGVVKSTEGQYLHTSKTTFHDVGIALYGECHEVNIANVPSGYTLKPHYQKALDDESKNTVKAGSFIRLFHREVEHYLVAEGSFANKGKVVMEDVHLRKRKSENGRLRPPSTSAITYWQIEKERVLSGEPMIWEERCRIKHLPTRMYLAVVRDEDSSLKVTLKDKDVNKTDLDTVFRLKPVIEEGSEMIFESYARINHPLTNSWLNAKQSEYVKQSFDHNATGLKALQWDTADLKEIGVVSEMKYHEAFTVEKVDDSLIQKFNCIAEVIPIITTYIEERERDPEKLTDYKDAYVMIEALDVMTKFIGSGHVDLLNRQKLLRNLMVIELVIQMLEIHNPELPQDSPQHKVSKACYQLLEVYLRGKSAKNNVYLARFIPMFRKHIGLDLNVEDMMIELIRDNEEIILNYGTEDVNDIIDHLLQTKDSRFMDFLSVLCACDGQIIVEHQDSIVENLLYKHSKKLFYSTGVGSDLPIQTGSPYTIYFCKPDELAWNSIHSVAPGSKDFQFLLAQLNLFGALCKGNNRKAIEAVDKDFKFVTFNEALIGAKDANLDFTIRSKYVELIIVLYVDASNDNRSILEDLSLSFNYAELRENPYEEASKNPTVALTGAMNIHFPDLRDWIQLHVASQQNVIGGKEMMGSNTFNANVIDLLHLLVKYGYYANLADIENLMPLLISLLDGSNDKPSIQASKEEHKDFTKVGRFKNTEENRPVFNLKVKVLKTVNLFFNFRCYLRLQNYIFDYKLLKSGAQATRLLSSPPNHLAFSDYQEYNRHSHQYPLPPAQLAQLDCGPEKLTVHNNKRLMAMAVSRLEKIFSFSEYVYEKSGQYTVSLPEVLLDLAAYENDEILSESLHLLNRYYSSEETLFEQAIQTQLLINSNSKKVLAEVTGELLPVLRRLALKDVNEKEFQELIKTIRKLISFCHLKDAVHEPHYQNQQILYNTGVFSDMMNLIFRKNFKPKNAELHQDEVGKSQQEIIVSVSLQFLKMLARNYKVVQERLFDSVDKFLDLNIASPDVGEMLSEVFTGVKEICLKVKEKHITKMFKLIATHNGCPELLEMLQAIVKAEDLDLPLKHNQMVIIKHFNLNRDKFCDYLLGKEPEKEQKRESILLYAEDSDHDLQVLLKVIGLFAACCEGENLFIESICQNIISISELMRILNNHKIKPDRKRPFAVFLLWGYINTGKDAALTGSIELIHSPEMWHYLEHINIVLNGIIRILSNLSKTQVASMKLASNQQLRRRATKRVHIDGDRGKEYGKVVTSHANIPYVTNANGELIPGVLQYIMEGVLPLIKVYYVRLFDPYKPDQSVYQKEIQVSANIATTLLHLEDVMVTYDQFSSQEHWKTLCDTIITVISHNCYNEGMIDVDIDIKSRFNDHMQARFNDHVDHKVVGQSATTKVYLQEYEPEKKLNENFNNFVQNFQLAYWGPNTVAHQIGSPYATRYSEFVEGAEFKEKGDEWLPLGLMHQKHVACFVSHKQNETTVDPVTKRVIDYLLVSYNRFSQLTEKEKVHLRLQNVKYLQLLRTIIHNEIMFTDPTLREQGQDPREFRRQSERVRAVQDQIQEYGNGSTITELVKLLLHPDESISAEVLAFLTILLYSGNRKIQNSFSSYVHNTREEKFFVSIQQRLEQAAHNDSERRELLNQLKLKHTEEMILSDLFNEYAVQYGFRKASLSLFGQPNVKRLSYKEEDAFGIHSSTKRLIESSDNLAMELQEIGPKRKQVTFNHTSALYTKPGTATARKLSVCRPTITHQESLPRIRVAKEEIQQQKQEGEAVEKSAENSKTNTLKFRDTSYIELALRFLGLLCDGQNRVIQNYFREQPDNIKTINLVSESCTFLQSFYVEVTKDNIDLITEILLTLIEMCVANFANQKVMYNLHIVDVVNRLLQTTLFHQCTLPKVLKLKSTAIKILEIMCEETSPLTKDLVKNVFKAVDINTLHTSLAYFYKLSQDEEMKRLQENDNAERAMFATYHILIHFADFQGISMEMISPRCDENTTAERYRDDNINRAWKRCQKQSKSIELLYEGDDGESTLAKVHFNVPESNELSEEIKEKVKYNVDRSSPEDKIRDFSKWIESVKREVQLLNHLRAHWYTNIFMINMRWRNHVLFLWTVVLNILMIIAWDDTIAQRVTNGTEIDVPTVPRQDENWFFSVVLYIGGGIHLLISLAVVITYFLINGSNFVMPDFFYRIFRRNHEPSYSDVPFFGLRTMYHIAFVGCSALSLVFYGYFYCLCLFHVVVDNDILQRVLKSVTKNGRSLLWVAILGLIIIYIYAVATFIFMPNDFDNQEGEVGEAVRYCHTLFECTITVVEYGLLDTLGATVDLPTNFKDATLRAIFYDLTFFIIVTTIGLNIVFGIIVDTFSELRDERYNIEQDKNGFCFICNIPSFEFERRAEGFDHHVKKEHCMWDYIYYIMYLEGIDISDHNALEHYVHCQINREDKNTGYFPLFQARSLREKTDDALNELGELKKMMSIIVEYHEEMKRTEAIQKHKEDQAEWERKYQAEQMEEQFSHI